MLRILFVDDEPRVLDGLRRMLRSMRNEWDMIFVTGPQEAMAAMEEKAADVVVSDMKMPGMNGAALLTEIKRLYPATVRLILSGQSDTAVTMQAIGCSHQFLMKPSDPEVLKQAIGRAHALVAVFGDPRLAEILNGINTLPSPPMLYQKIVDCLKRPDATLVDVGAIIAQDPAMTSAILKLVNSAYFGLPRPITSVERAIPIIGMEPLISLVLGHQLFSAYGDLSVPGFSPETLWRNSIQTAGIARKLALSRTDTKPLADDAFLSGLLHDVGKLVLASYYPDRYAEILARAAAIGEPAAEQEYLKTGHGEIGAYLIGLWGLPHSVVEALAFHEYPSTAPTRGFSLPAIVHIAELITRHPNAVSPAQLGGRADTACLAEINAEAHWPEWLTAQCTDIPTTVA